MVAEVNKEDQTIHKEALEILWSSLQFEEYQIHKESRSIFKQKENSVVLVQWIKIMQSTYKKLLSKFCVGKKFLEMQHSWLMHINYYVQGAAAMDICGLHNDDKMKLHDVWKAVIDETAKFNVSLCDVEQRIIVSSLANIVFDLMGRKVKEKKEREMEMDSFSDSKIWHEGSVTMYRYARAALHSMIQKRKKLFSKHPELRYIAMMSAGEKHKECHFKRSRIFHYDFTSYITIFNKTDGWN